MLESGPAGSLGSDPPLPARLDLLPLSAAEIIITVAGRLAFSAERPNHTSGLVSLSLVATERLARTHVVMSSEGEPERWAHRQVPTRRWKQSERTRPAGPTVKDFADPSGIQQRSRRRRETKRLSLPLRRVQSD